MIDVVDVVTMNVDIGDVNVADGAENDDAVDEDTVGSVCTYGSECDVAMIGSSELYVESAVAAWDLATDV